jgi:uncharacterized protein (TIGR02757 family)
MNHATLKALLDEKVTLFNAPSFINNDPISIPHQFTLKQDREIAGLFAALFAWGQRVTTINKCVDLLQRMDDAPYNFIRHHTESDLKIFKGFAHRTFNETDLLYTLHFLKTHYAQSDSLETAFFFKDETVPSTIEPYLIHFHNAFFQSEYAPLRTRKHIPTPLRGSSCKRLCMYLRWMVRRDNAGVDFGIWERISPAQLICPIDVHVERIARRYGLLTQKNGHWKAALELTENLRAFDLADPVKYDFALFGMGVLEKLRPL